MYLAAIGRIMRCMTGSLAERFEARSNSIGFLRLLFATTVVFSHTWPAGGFGADPGWPGINPGILAVDGFMVLSGFLITASAERCGTVARFLWCRFLRIMPGFWVALAAIWLVFSFAASGAFQAGGWRFVASNFGLSIQQWSIGSTLQGNPFGTDWTGPMYTLAIEFACYLVVAVLLAAGLIRRTWVLGMLAGLAWLWMQVEMARPGADYRQARFTLAFLVGALLWREAHRVSVRPTLAVAAGLIMLAVAATGDYRIYASVGIPAFAYLCLWLATFLPMRGVGVRTDLSYGVYLYGWPVQQTLAVWGFQQFGVWAFLLASLAGAAGCAMLSWRFIEEPAMRLKRREWPSVWIRQPRTRSAVASSR